MQNAETLHSKKVPVILPLWRVWEFSPSLLSSCLFQRYGFQSSNHIIKAVHHFYSSSKVSDNLQMFSIPAAKLWTNINTLGSIDNLTHFVFLAWFLWEWELTCTIFWQFYKINWWRSYFCWCKAQKSCVVFLISLRNSLSTLAGETCIMDCFTLRELEIVSEDNEDLIFHV